jgi:pimeloyl-ACP methyl ester carboxylesterase
MPRSLSQLAKELHALLKNAGEQPPYLLVDHSFGKGSVLVFNKLYPDEVVGMVLSEGGPSRLKLPASILTSGRADLRRRQRLRMFAPGSYFFGISRFLARKDIEGTGESIYDQECRITPSAQNSFEQQRVRLRSSSQAMARPSWRSCPHWATSRYSFSSLVRACGAYR